MDRSTELRRLAKALHKTPAELDYLSTLDASDIHQLRVSFQNALLDKVGPVFEKVTHAGKMIPDVVGAKLCTKVFGPNITANMSYYAPVKKVVKMCEIFDVDFLAEVARHQIPERAAVLLAEIPVEKMKEVMLKLLESGDFHLLGGFTDHIPEQKIRVLMDRITDPADQLRISQFAQRKDRIASIVCQSNEKTLREWIKTAITYSEFLVEIAMIAAEMDADSQHGMALLTDKVDPSYRAIVRDVAQSIGYTEKLRPYIEA